MWEEVVAGASGVVALAGGLAGLYIALRHEIRRSHELLQKDVVHLDGRLGRVEGDVGEGFTELTADIRRLDQKIDAVRGELIGYLGSR